MNLPKVVYENTPYVYFTIGLTSLAKADGVILYCSAVLFYLAGAMVWCLRSNARRKDSPSKLATSFFNKRLNDSLYELMPFLQILFAITLVRLFDHDIISFIAIVIGVYALQNLILRIQNRKKNATDLAFGKRISSKNK